MGEQQRDGFEEHTPKAADRAMCALGGYRKAARDLIGYPAAQLVAGMVTVAPASRSFKKGSRPV